MERADFKFSPEQKAPPRKGRRAQNVTGGSLEDSAGDSSLSPSIPKGMFSEPMAPPRSRKTGGWADETLRSGKSRTNSTNLIEQERFQSPERTRGLDSDDEIPLIPDVDVQDDDLLDIAEAPIISAGKGSSFSQIDSDLCKKPGFATLDDVNLSTLTKNLNSENELKEPDIRWSWDLLFTEVSSEIRSEKGQYKEF